MNRHLSDHELNLAAAGLELAERAAEHLGGCLSCRSRVAAFHDLVAQRRRLVTAEEPPWHEQHAAILAALATQPVALRRQRWRMPVLAAAAALLVAVALGALLRSGDPGTPAPRQEVLQVELLLAEVDALLADDSIPGLWPVDPLSDSSEVESLISKDAS